jgi:hypothetical protein
MAERARQPQPLDPALLRIIEALARRQARLDYAATQEAAVKVSELISELTKWDPELPVVVHMPSDDGELGLVSDRPCAAWVSGDDLSRNPLQLHWETNPAPGLVRVLKIT